MRTVVVIPARYASSRFPGKPLVNLLDKPMVIWVAEIAAVSVGKENVYIATDEKRISKIAESFQYNYIMTDSNLLTGTDRVAQAAEKINADIYVNLQGDEPLVLPENINKIIKQKVINTNYIVNGYCHLSVKEDPNNINIPKVITNEKSEMVYMSRKAIPGTKSLSLKNQDYKKQVCIYAFNYKELQDFRNFGRKSYLEENEDIEILRFLELKKNIFMVELSSGSLAVDVPEDVPLVEEKLKIRAKYS